MANLEHRIIGDMGQVALPRKLRQALGWGVGAVVTIYQDGDTLIIKLADNQEEARVSATRSDETMRRYIPLDGGGAGPPP